MAEISSPERGQRTAGPGLSFKVASKLYNRPLALVETFAEILRGAVDARAFDQPGGVHIASPGASKFFGQMAGQGRYHVTDDHIAIVHVAGTLVDRGDWLGDLWGMMTSYEGIAEQCRRIAADQAIRAVILDIDSPGGMVAGMFDVAQEVAKLGRKKPIYAVAQNCACSAAYALASVADEIYVTRAGEIGSIGVLAIHQTYARALDAAGVDTTIIRSDSSKANRNPYEQLSHVARSDTAAEVDEAASQFVRHVAKARSLEEDAVRALGARVYIGQKAVDAKLADGVKSFEEVLAHIRKDKPVSRPARSIKPTGASMKTQDDGGLSAADGNAILSAFQAGMTFQATAKTPAAPAAVATVAPPVAPAAPVVSPTAPAADANTAAVDRIKKILSSDEGKKRPQLAAHFAFEMATMGADDAIKALAAAPEEAPSASAGSPFLAAMRQPGSSAGVAPDGTSKANGQSASAGLPVLKDSIAAKTATAPPKFGFKR